MAAEVLDTQDFGAIPDCPFRLQSSELLILWGAVPIRRLRENAGDGIIWRLLLNYARLRWFPLPLTPDSGDGRLIAEHGSFPDV
jgi:hypothetical protein